MNPSTVLARFLPAATAANEAIGPGAFGAATSASGVAEVDGLYFSYPGRLLFLNQHRRIEAGLTWLRSPQGSGKSTMLKLLGGVMRPARGDIRVAGWSQAHAPQGYRREVFWCGQGPVPYEYLSVAAYLDAVKSAHPRFDADRAFADAEVFGLSEDWRRPVSKLPLPVQRKVWLTAALASGVTLTLFDEPFQSLAEHDARYLWQRLAQQAKLPGRAIVVASERDDLGARGRAVDDLSARTWEL